MQTKKILGADAYKLGCAVCKKLKITPYRLCKDLPLGNSTWYRWKRYKNREAGLAYKRLHGYARLKEVI